MTDTLTPTERSTRMAHVRDRDTKPELIVRRFLHAAGLRYRLHQRIVGSRPDLVFPSSKIAVMIHGCMWHQHPDPNCRLARMPKSRLDFWRPKLEGNRLRDGRQQASLEAAGWKVLIIWECQVGRSERLEKLANEIREHGRSTAA
jgi:DNA mismatch endonuclease (patch repair protein)